MWQEYCNGYSKNAKVNFSSDVKTPCADVVNGIIYIPRGMMDTPRARIMVKHELGHLLFTDPGVGGKDGYHHLFSNAIEDVRIEARFSRRYAGIAKDFKDHRQEIENTMQELPAGPAGAAAFTMCKLAGVKPNAHKKLHEAWKVIGRDIHDKYYSCKNTADCVKLADYAIERWKEFIKFNPPESDPKPGSGGKGKAGGADDDTKRTVEAVKSGGYGAWQGKTVVYSGQDLIKAIRSGDLRRTCKAGGYPSPTYRRDKSIISRTVNRLNSLLRDKLLGSSRSRTLRLKKRGKISARDLFRAIIENPAPRCFKKKTEKIDNTIALSILVDHSGSMQYGQKINLALHLIEVFDNACQGIPGLALEINGFTTLPATSAGEDNLIMRYRSFEDRAGSVIPAVLGHARNIPLRENVDHVAVMHAGQRLLSRPEKNKYLFIISDGRPASSRYNSNGLVRDLITALNRLAPKINIVSFGCGVYSSWKGIYSSVQSFIIDELDHLPGKMVDQLDKAITEIVGT